MSNVFELNRRKLFSLTEAQALLPLILRITQQYSKRVQVLLGRVEAIQGHSETRVHDLEEQVNSLVQEWQTKMEKLGAHTKGLWIADLDSGDGYFCWKFPEERIEYWHKYSDGFSGRQKIEHTHHHEQAGDTQIPPLSARPLSALETTTDTHLI